MVSVLLGSSRHADDFSSVYSYYPFGLNELFGDVKGAGSL